MVLDWLRRRFSGAPDDPKAHYRDASELEAVLRAFGLGERASDIAALGAWGADLFVSKDGSASVSGTRVGGKPSLASDASWPYRRAMSREEQAQCYATAPASDPAYYDEPRPYAFIAQVNFHEISESARERLELPPDGILSFFYDVELQTWGFDPIHRVGWQILYTPSAEKNELKDFPDDLPEQCRFPERALKPVLTFRHPPVETLAFRRLGLTDREKDDYWRFLERFENEIPYGSDVSDWTEHRLAGWPEVVQNAMEEECALVSSGIYVGDADGYHSADAKCLLAEPNDWRLLLQIGSDDDVGFMWGDMGNLYVWIRQADLAEARFDRCHVILQCS